MNLCRKHIRKIALSFLAIFLLELYSTNLAWALTSGPAQPEFSSFEPVVTTNMVNDFTGQFTYNLPVVEIPGPNGAGYAMSLSYHSGVTVEEEASWVGYGWTLNPGSINRSVNGIADDVNGDTPKHWNKSRDMTTVTVGGMLDFELSGITKEGMNIANLGAGLGVRYNNYHGFGYSVEVNAGVASGALALNVTLDDGRTTYAPSFNLSGVIKTAAGAAAKSKKMGKIRDFLKSRQGKNLKKVALRSADHYSNSFFTVPTFSVAAPTKNLSSYNFNLQAGGELSTFFNIGLEGTMYGNVASQFISDPLTNVPNYGYIHLRDDDNAIQDFSLEKDAGYNTRDKFIPMPVASPDNFSLTGEGLGGTFRYWRNEVGHFKKPSESSWSDIISGGVEFGAGMWVGAGGNASYGSVENRMSDWGGGSGNHSFGGSDKGFFRFDQDPASEVKYDDPNTNDYRQADRMLRATSGSNPNFSFISSSVLGTPNESRSSLINSTTFTDFKDIASVSINGTTQNIYHKSRTKQTEIHSWIASKQIEGNKICEFSVKDKSGFEYIYGMPLFNNYEYSTSGSFSETYPITADNRKGHILKEDASLEQDSKSYNNFENSDPVANSYLITEILSDNYIDRTFDGPSIDDFGAWTKFTYKTGNEYQWRTPFTGWNYHKGDIHTRKDDMISYQTGKRDVAYLKTVETATHVGFFVCNKSVVADFATNHEETNFNLTDYLTGSGTDRKDGKSTNGSYPLKLEKIVLFARNSAGQLTGKPVKVVYLEYDATGLCKNLPNAEAGNGKLTLKRVWFEYEGIKNAKISPYVFSYDYKTPASYSNVNLKNKYSDIIYYGFNATDDPNKNIVKGTIKYPSNPDYYEEAADAWGYYRGVNGETWAEQEKTWVDQSKTDYDPAAWNLKSIKLPSGGEILVQYEQADYSYVMDEQAMAMVSLGANGSFTLNLADLEDKYNYNSTNLEQLRLGIKNYLDANGNRLYYKFLYKVMADGKPVGLDDPKSEYMSGYAKVGTPTISGGTILIPTSDAPKLSCQDYAQENVVGNVSLYQNEETGVTEIDRALSIFEALLEQLTNIATPNSAFCNGMDNSLSYIRIPLPIAKKGGGIRVKRILMYDQSNYEGDNSDEVLYGTEYYYKNEDGTSSGVASNEPASIREENALVKYMDKREPQSRQQKNIAGEDKEQFEGPYGESFLPSPSIGYGRVVKVPIHTGKTNTGFQISEFYTYKDFPQKTEVSQADSRQYNYNPPFQFFYSTKINQQYITQGFLIKKYCMNGQPKANYTYQGCTDAGTSYWVKPDPSQISIQERFVYYDPEKPIDVLMRGGTNGYQIIPQFMGKEQDLYMYKNAISSVKNTFKGEFDFGVHTIPPPFWPIPIWGNFIPGYGYELQTFHVHATTKAITYPTYLKYKEVIKNGISTKTENLVYDKLTGQPVITRTYDTYDGLSQGNYDSYTIPAHLVYPSMGLASRNANYKSSYSFSIIKDGTIQGKYKSSAVIADADLLSKLSTGDLLCLNDKQLFFIDNISAGVLYLNAVSTAATPISVTSLKVLNSGNVNLLTASVGSITTYGISQSNGKPYSPLILDNGAIKMNSSLSNIINASAVTMSNDWVLANGKFYLNPEYNSFSPNPFLNGDKGKWRQKSNYSFKSETVDIVNATSDPAYKSGYAGTFLPFNYSDVASLDNTRWIKSSEVELYSPHGEALQERNALGVSSVAKFGYKGKLPVILSQNADYSNVLFESFESMASASEPLVQFNKYNAHTGTASFKLPGSNPSEELNFNHYYKLGTKAYKDGINVRFWIKSGSAEVTDVDIINKFSVGIHPSAPTYGKIADKMSLITRLGEWCLIEAIFNGSYVDDGMKNIGATYSNYFYFINNTGGDLYVDDFRAQPIGAQSKAYVYDNKTTKLLATFDDQHFAQIYQYNSEGKLVRKLIETERGLKTITETQYNQVQVSR